MKGDTSTLSPVKHIGVQFLPPQHASAIVSTSLALRVPGVDLHLQSLSWDAFVVLWFPETEERLTSLTGAMICWFNENPARPRAKYILKHTSNEPMAMITEIEYKVDVNTLHRITDDKEIKMNDICKVKLRTTAAIMMDDYSRNRKTGSFILIDAATNETVAGGMLQ